jgi:hypothetical protein
MSENCPSRTCEASPAETPVDHPPEHPAALALTPPRDTPMRSHIKRVLNDPG